MADRPTLFAMYIGYNRTGKTSVAIAYANLWKVNNPDGMVAGYDPQHKFKHLMDPQYRLSAGERGWWSNDKKRVKANSAPFNTLRNALVIFDDYRGLHDSDKTPEEFLRLCEFRAEYNLDIIMICHNPKLVAPKLAMYISHYFIFYTKGADSNFKDRIDHYEEAEKANQIMKYYVNSHPEVVTDHKSFFDHTMNGKHMFPHIIVDTDRGVLITQNVNEEWLKQHQNSF